jgi:hypothetical protein
VTSSLAAEYAEHLNKDHDHGIKAGRETVWLNRRQPHRFFRPSYLTNSSAICISLLGGSNGLGSSGIGATRDRPVPSNFSHAFLWRRGVNTGRSDDDR